MAVITVTLIAGLLIFIADSKHIDNLASATNATTATNSSIYFGAELTDVAINPSTKKIYVPDVANQVVFIIDGTRDEVIGNITLGGGLWKAVVDPITNRIYLPTSVGGIWVVDGNSDKVVSRILNSTIFDGVIAVDQDVGKIYVGTVKNTIFVIDEKTNTLLKEINQPFSAPVTVDPILHRLYYGASYNFVNIIDTLSDTPVGSFPVGNATAEFNSHQLILHIGTIVVDHNNHKLYIVKNGPSGVSVFDQSTLKQIAEIPVAANPTFMGINLSKHVVYVYCNNFASSKTLMPPGHYLYALNGTSDSVIDSIPLQILGPVAMAVSPSSDGVYLVNQVLTNYLLAIHNADAVESTPDFDVSQLLIVLGITMIMVTIILRLKNTKITLRS